MKHATGCLGLGAVGWLVQPAITGGARSRHCVADWLTAGHRAWMVLFGEAAPSIEASVIEIRGARTNNLRNLSVDIPKGVMTVITGLSGSGKSSLAFDTLFAEAQRQYIDSLAIYTRQYLAPLPRPDVDGIVGLQPTLCLDQQPPAANSRSTVGTLSETYDYLRLAMARLGEPICFVCGSRIERQSVRQVLESLEGLAIGSRIMILAPMLRKQRGDVRGTLGKLVSAGLVKVYAEGQVYDIEAVEEAVLGRVLHIDGVVDRLIWREESRGRLEEATEAALALSDGLVAYRIWDGEGGLPVEEGSSWEYRLMSTRHACLECGASYLEIEPRTFSFNSPHGACEECRGSGVVGGGLVVAKRGKEVKEGEEEDMEVEEGAACLGCQGARLRRESLSVRLEGKNIYEIASMDIVGCREWLGSLRWEGRTRAIAEPILRDLMPRLAFLEEVGLGYLALTRTTDTLSGGELQRVRLASSLGTGLVGVCFVLDEPSVGLHPRDNARLMGTLRGLQERGNTLVVVEHDEAIIREADYLIDMGPGAGKGGGAILASGSVAKVMGESDSITGPYLRGEKGAVLCRGRRVEGQGSQLVLEGITVHNLRDVSVGIPLGRLVGVTGVSGSGKSTLVQQALVPAMAAHLGWPGERRVPVRRLHGAEGIERMVSIDQRPIGRSPRSTPATYCGFLDELRKVYASTRDAKQRGFGPQRFSFNAGPGRCEACQGQGKQRLEMSFLADLFIPCPACQGKRYNSATLEVYYRERNIADCLAMEVSVAKEFFQNFVKIYRPLDCLERVGLGYLSLGQPSHTLSGGEAQRIKLAAELSRPTSGKGLIVLDEPTTGLHFEDVRRLIEVLQDLVDQGNTIVVIEHNLDVIRSCDWVIDMGPEGGQQGGRVVVSGTVEEVQACGASHTGCFLGRVERGAG